MKYINNNQKLHKYNNTLFNNYSFWIYYYKRNLLSFLFWVPIWGNNSVEENLWSHGNIFKILKTLKYKCLFLNDYDLIISIDYTNI